MTSRDNFKTKVVKCCDKSLSNIRAKMYEYLGASKLQSYFPILDNYFEFYNGSKCNFTLKTRFRIIEILSKKNHKIDDNYVKNFLNCLIKDVLSGETKEVEIFVKTLPLLNVTHYLTNEYSLKPTLLPNSFFEDTLKKINNPNNSAYIDVFFSYLGSRLTETGKCPAFPLFYGTYSGMMDEFKIDISEDYDDLKDDEDFIHLLGETFALEDAKIEQEPIVNSELLNSECIIEFDDVENALESILDEQINDEITLCDNEEADNEAAVNTEEADNAEKADNAEEADDREATEEADNADGGGADNAEGAGDTEEADDEAAEEADDREAAEEADDGLWEDISDSLEISSDNDNDFDIDTADEGDEIDIASILRDSIQNSENDVRVLGSDCSFSDISDISSDSDLLKYAKIPDFPVQFNFIETLDGTLDNYIDNSINKKIHPTEWKSILFQICFGLSVAQKHFLFVHNDLHSSNIMFKKTDNDFLYYKIGGKFFKIPTFNKISKIIDFGRATFKLRNKIYFSDVFMKNEDAWGQYNYPYNNPNSLKNCKIKPNMSFDLSRFATTIIERFDNCDESYDETSKALTSSVH